MEKSPQTGKAELECVGGLFARVAAVRLRATDRLKEAGEVSM